MWLFLDSSLAVFSWFDVNSKQTAHNLQVNKKIFCDHIHSFTNTSFFFILIPSWVHCTFHKHYVVSMYKEEVIGQEVYTLLGLIIQKDVSFVWWNNVWLLELMNPGRELLLTPSHVDRCDGTSVFRVGHCSCWGTEGFHVLTLGSELRPWGCEWDPTSPTVLPLLSAFLPHSPVKPEGHPVVTK